MAGPYVLLQFGADFFALRFEDLEGRLAFTVKLVEDSPNLILKLTREAPWAQQHPSIMGPSSSFFYFGPSRTPGYLAYGNSPTQPMANSYRQKKEGSTSHYFTTQSGAEYKWRTSPRKYECLDSRGTVQATWEMARLEDEFHARVTIKHSALPIITEILTTLCLHLTAHSLKW